MLDLVRTSKNPSGEWSADDYDVFEGQAQVGRITLTSGAGRNAVALGDHCA